MEKNISLVNPSRKGRPRLKVDYAIVLRLRDVDKLGWAQIAEKYRNLTGKRISKETAERRYDEIKAQQATVAVYYKKTCPSPAAKPQLVYERVAPSPQIVEFNGQKFFYVKKGPEPTPNTPTSACPPDTK